ncbi:hypothetical protein P7C73_g606, partial [Tremellales sp. Uapishka_1]
MFSASPPSLGALLLIPGIYSTIFQALPVHSYIPAVAINDTSGLNLTDSSTISLTWSDPAGVYSDFVSYQLEADVATGGTTKGALVHFTESSAGPNLTTSTPWIAYISCDVNETDASQEWDIFTLARDRGAVSALLYTANAESCLINSEYITDFEKPLDVFATKTRNVAVVINNQFQNTNDSFYTYNGTLLNSSGTAVNESILGTPLDVKTYLSGTLTARNSTGQANPTDIPNASSTASNTPHHTLPSGYIALFVIVGLIVAVLILVVCVSATRIIRDPERYGRREGDSSAPPQTRAGGIAQAILDTFPVRQFNRNERNERKRLSSEMELAEHKTVGEDTDAEAGRPKSYHSSTEGESSSTRSRSLVGSNRNSRAASRLALTSMTEEPSGEVLGAGDQCPICLLDFETGDDLRVLPCEREHVYHKACIDPWLLQVSSSCPLCRKDFNEPMTAKTSTTPTPNPQTHAQLPTQPPPAADDAPTSSPRTPPTGSGFAKYLAFMRRERRSRNTSSTSTDSGIGRGRRREADQTGPGGY